MRRFIFILAVLASGCAANPSVKYVISGGSSAALPPKDMTDAFYLQRNTLTLEFKNSAPEGKPPATSLLVTNTRTEDDAKRIIVLRGDSAWTRTTINLTKVENTDLIATAGVEVVDRRSELIQTVGTAVKTLLPILVAGDAGDANLGTQCPSFPSRPCKLDPLVDLKMNRGQGTKKSGPLSVVWAAVPADAVNVDSIFSTTATARMHGLYYAACRKIEFTLIAKGVAYSWAGKIADPGYVEYVAFPRKGSIRMHDQCGVSVTTDKDPTQPMDQVIGTAITQAIAIKDALDKAKDDGAK